MGRGVEETVGKHNQDILNEKNLFSTKERNCCYLLSVYYVLIIPKGVFTGFFNPKEIHAELIFQHKRYFDLSSKDQKNQVIYNHSKA